MAISYDPVSILRVFTEKRGIGFPLLSDPRSEVIEAFGILNVEAQSTTMKGIPSPGTLLVANDGRIVAKLFHSGYKKRHGAADIIRAARAARSGQGQDPGGAGTGQ